MAEELAAAVACLGHGANLGYYRPDIHWIGIEPNLHMHPYIQREARRCDLRNAEIRDAPAETIDLAEGSIDAVVSTHVLCSVGDLDATLERIRRILRPGGRFVFLEHVAAQEGSCTRAAQDGLKAFWSTVFDGCHPNRETSTSLDRPGFASVAMESLRLSVPVISPHIAGVATRRRSWAVLREVSGCLLPLRLGTEQRSQILQRGMLSQPPCHRLEGGPSLAGLRRFLRGPGRFLVPSGGVGHGPERKRCIRDGGQGLLRWVALTSTSSRRGHDRHPGRRQLRRSHSSPR
jgi:hypothetical protein